MAVLMYSSENTDLWHFALQAGSAMLSGLLIGLEREYKGKNAGLKTNTLVAIGAAVFVAISLRFRDDSGVDLTRVLSQVVIGIGFLGGGAILQKSDKIEGLTTAATIWCSAAAGCLAAMAMFMELALLTLLVLSINTIFSYVDHNIERKIKKKDEG